MRHVHPHQLAANRRLQAQASFTAVELAASQQRARDRVTKARNDLRDVIIATGVPTFHGVAILAAAETFAKAATQAVSALPSPDPVPIGDGILSAPIGSAA